MNTCVLVTFFTAAILSVLCLVWMIVPTEQTLDVQFPNVLILAGFGSMDIEPVTHDNTTLPVIPAAQAANVNGFYQYGPQFYHKSLDRFIPWEERGMVSIWECTIFCGATNASQRAETRTALIQQNAGPKKNLWWLVEVRDDDADSPVILARTKYRKTPTYRVPFVTVTDRGKDVKSKDIADAWIYSAWDAFRFDTPLKLGVTAVLVVATSGYLWWKKRQDDDD